MLLQNFKLCRHLGCPIRKMFVNTALDSSDSNIIIKTVGRALDLHIGMLNRVKIPPGKYIHLTIP